MSRVGHAAVGKFAFTKSIYTRERGTCNPGGVESRLASIPMKFSGIISPGIGVGMGRMVCMGN